MVVGGVAYMKAVIRVPGVQVGCVLVMVVVLAAITMGAPSLLAPSVVTARR